MTRIHSIQGRRLAGLGVALAVLAAGCSSGASSAERTSSAASSLAGSMSPLPGASGPSASGQSVSPSLDADRPVVADVEVAYRGYWAARVKAQTAPEDPIPAELDRYAIDWARTDVKASVVTFRQQGVAFRGEPVLSPRTTVTGAGTSARASVVDCVDSSGWKPVFVATGKSALAPGQPMRVVVESTARIYSGHWVIDTLVAHRDRTC